MRLVLALLIILLTGCAVAPKSAQHQQVEGIKDMEAFGKNATKLINRLARKLGQVGDEKALLETELAIEQEVIQVPVVVKKAADGKPAEVKLQKFLTPEVIAAALKELARLQKENDDAVWGFLNDWVVIKGDLRLGLSRARLIRKALERRGIAPEDVRSFSDGIVDGLEGVEPKEDK